MKKMKGFTLLEILIVVLVISILASIAVYNYRNYILRSHRVDAIKLLLDAAAREENFYSFKYKYTDQLVELGLVADQSEYGFYKLNITLADNGKAYTLKAIPQGGQVGDECGILELNSDGEKKASLPTCWN